MDPVVELGGIIKTLRLKKNISVSQLAFESGIQPIFVGFIERGEKLPGPESLKSMLRVLIEDEKQRAEVQRYCLFLLAKAKAAPEIRDYLRLDDKQITARPVEALSMPQGFVERLKLDYEAALNDPKISEDIEFERPVIEGAISGKIYLSRPAVVKLARKLNQPLEEYLSLAGYIPDEVFRLLKNRKFMIILRTIHRLSEDELDMLLDVILKVLKIFKKE